MLLVLTTAAWNLVRLLIAIAWGGVLEYYAPHPVIPYIAVSGAVWTTGASVVFCGLGRRAGWAPRALLIGAWLYAAWVWLDRVLLQSGGSPNWRFALIGTMLLLGFITAVTLDRNITGYFGKEAHDPEPQD